MLNKWLKKLSRDKNFWFLNMNFNVIFLGLNCSDSVVNH